MDDWAKFTQETRVANGLTPVPSFKESLGHFWCMLAHGAHQTTETFQPRMVKITCDKCRIYWIESRV
jgi:hypothetical protein